MAAHSSYKLTVHVLERWAAQILDLEKMIKKGSRVKWNWGNGTAEGRVEKTYSEKVTKTIKGVKITRNGEEGNKALYIVQDNGDHVLKSESEVEHI